MNKIILDASALLAMLNSENGKDAVEKILPSSVMSTVNISEVIGELESKLQIPTDEGKKIVTTLVNEIVHFNLEHAIESARIKKYTKAFGLSLGDRACLALGKIMSCPVYTADRAWIKLDIGVKINLIR